MIEQAFGVSCKDFEQLGNNLLTFKFELLDLLFLNNQIRD